MYSEILINEILKSNSLVFSPFNINESDIKRRPGKPTIVSIIHREQKCVLAKSLIIVDDLVSQNDINVAYENKLMVESEIISMMDIERYIVQTTIILNEKNRGIVKLLNLNQFENRHIFFYFFKIDVTLAV